VETIATITLADYPELLVAVAAGRPTIEVVAYGRFDPRVLSRAEALARVSAHQAREGLR